VLAAQEDLITEALKAKESLRAQMTSPNGKEESGSQIHQLRIRLEQVTAEWLEEAQPGAIPRVGGREAAEQAASNERA
jgi:hypothetical protein